MKCVVTITALQIFTREIHAVDEKEVERVAREALEQGDPGDPVAQHTHVHIQKLVTAQPKQHTATTTSAAEAEDATKE